MILSNYIWQNDMHETTCFQELFLEFVGGVHRLFLF